MAFVSLFVPYAKIEFYQATNVFIQALGLE